MTIARHKNGWVCPKCTRNGLTDCRCDRDQWIYGAPSVAEQFRESQRRERRRLAFLLLFVAAVILVGAYFGSTP